MDTEPEKTFSFPLLTDVHWAAQDVVEYLAFSSELEAMLNSNHAKLERKIEAKLNTAPKEDHGEIMDTYAYDLHQSQSLFPAMHRESMFITLYHYLEHTLNTVCEGIGDEVGSEIRINDLRGKGFERALLFLKRVPKFDLSKISEDVGYIRNANKLRNLVVHNGAILPGDENDRVNIFVKTESSLSGEPGKSVSFKEEFLCVFGARVQVLFEEIGNEMQRFMGNRV